MFTRTHFCYVAESKFQPSEDGSPGSRFERARPEKWVDSWEQIRPQAAMHAVRCNLRVWAVHSCAEGLGPCVPADGCVLGN